MNRLASYALLALVALAFAACDTAEDERSDAELFVGTWTLVGVRDAGGDRTALVQAAGDLRVVFAADRTYELTFDPVEGSAQTVDNTYLVVQNLGRITLNATVPGSGDVPVVMDYAYSGDDEVVLALDEAYVQIVAAVVPPLGQLEGDVELTLRRD